MMIRTWITDCCLLALCWTWTAAQEKKPLTNQDVVAMAKSGLGESTILMAIQASPAEFDVSVPALINLKSQNVSETLIRAMVAAAGHKNTAPAASAEISSPVAVVRKKAPEFRAFQVDFYAESFATLGVNASPISEGKMFVGKGRLRFESTSPRDSSAMMIIDPLKPVAYVLSRGKAAEVKTVFQGVRGSPEMTEGISMFLLPTDPQDPCENWVSVECKAMGTEIIDGRSATKWDLTHRFEEETWHTYIWVDVKLHIVSKRQFKENVFELRNIVEAPQASGLFDLP